MAALDGDGVAIFLNAAEGSPYRDVFFTALYTGLRRSEVLALRWPDVDLERSTIRVTAGLHRLTGMGLVLLPTKTARSRRQVTITQELVDVLRSIRGSQMMVKMELGPAWEDTGFVFTKTSGKPLDPEKVTHNFTSIVRTAGLKGVRLHDLRHTHASLMLQAGVHPKIVSERLGHAGVAITMDTYSHVLPGLQEGAAERFSKLLSGRRNG